jgi:DNA-binding MarR family transcriptional regulator
MHVATMAGHHIRRLHQISTQVFARSMHEAGLDITPVQFAALDALCANPGIDQAGVAALIACDRATAGGVIDRLVDKHMVARIINARDRRARELHLTQAGRIVFDAALPLARNAQDEIVRGLTRDERAMLLKLIGKAIATADPDGDARSAHAPAPLART